MPEGSIVVGELGLRFGKAGPGCPLEALVGDGGGEGEEEEVLGEGGGFEGGADGAAVVEPGDEETEGLGRGGGEVDGVLRGVVEDRGEVGAAGGEDVLVHQEGAGLVLQGPGEDLGHFAAGF